jgi:hypothetical protein
MGGFFIGGGRVDVGNGTTTEFPLPSGKFGSAVWLISPEGTATRMKLGSAYTVLDGTVFFSTPPPEGWVVSFEALENATNTGTVCTVIYPDGTMQKVERDPWELLLSAKNERAEAKKLLRDAQNAIEAAERVVHVESEIAKEKLSARLDKYGTLVEESIKSAASGARDELRDYLGEQIEEVRTKHDEVVNARKKTHEACQCAEEAAALAAKSAVEQAKKELDAMAFQAFEACENTWALKSELISLRDEAKSAAASAASDVQKTAGEYMKLVLEEIRSLRNTAGNEFRIEFEKEKTSIAGLTSEIKEARVAAQTAATRAMEVERKCLELDTTQRIREEGMKALWERITSFKKTFDNRVSQTRARSGGIGEGEE